MRNPCSRTRFTTLEAVLFDFGNTLVLEEPGKHLLDMALEPLPYAIELLAALKPRYQLGIVSNTVASGDAEVREALRRMGLLDAFALVISSRDAGVAKPEPGIFRLAAERLGVPPHAIAMVGDRLDTDIAGARAAGIAGIWLCHDPRQRRVAMARLADFTVHSLREVPACLEAIARRG